MRTSRFQVGSRASLVGEFAALAALVVFSPSGRWRGMSPPSWQAAVTFPSGWKRSRRSELAYACRESKTWVQNALTSGLWSISLLIPAAANGITLEMGQFIASQGLFTSSSWTYTGTIPENFNAGFKARSEESVCIPGVTCDNQYTTGGRVMTSTAGSNPSYRLTFNGSFGTPEAERWEGSLLDKSKGNTQTDIDNVTFVNPNRVVSVVPSPTFPYIEIIYDTAVTNEHPIPSAWRSPDGYGLATSAYTEFTKTYTLKTAVLEPGQSGCPKTIPGSGGAASGLCVFDSTWAKIGANLEGAISGKAAVPTGLLDPGSVLISAEANRIASFKINDQSLYSDSLNGNYTSFNLVANNPTSLTVNLTSSTQGVVATSSWNLSSGTGSFDVPYVYRSEMKEYAEVLGSETTFVLKARDDPQLVAGISGDRFNTASVESYVGMSALDASLLPVFQAIGLEQVGDLVVTNARAKGSNQLPIPPPGFRESLLVPFSFELNNRGGIGLTITGLELEFVDKDLIDFFDDLLGSVNAELNIFLAPDAKTHLDFSLLVPASRLNEADDLFEGGYLELAASGKFRFEDTFGTRARDFGVSFVPEPSTWHLLAIGVALLLTVDWRRRPSAWSVGV